MNDDDDNINADASYVSNAQGVTVSNYYDSNGDIIIWANFKLSNSNGGLLYGTSDSSTDLSVLGKVTHIVKHTRCFARLQEYKSNDPISYHMLIYTGLIKSKYVTANFFLFKLN